MLQTDSSIARMQTVLSPENRKSLAHQFHLDQSDIASISVTADAGLGDKILGFLVADYLDQVNNTNTVSVAWNCSFRRVKLILAAKFSVTFPTKCYRRSLQ